MNQQIILQVEDIPSARGSSMPGSSPPLAWTWRKGENWVVLGDNGSGKSRFLDLLERRAGEGARSVSFEGLERLVAEEIRQDDSNFLGRTDTGTPLFRFLGLDSPGAALPLPASAHFTGLLAAGIRTLSTGEMRCALLYQAMLARPSLLLLDEPFDGLDQQATAAMCELIRSLVRAGPPLLLALNRTSEMLPEHSHVAVFRDNALVFAGTRDEWQQFNAQHPRNPPASPPIPAAPQNALRLQAGVPLVRMRDVTVRYGHRTILDRLAWQVDPGVHWQITGPNGAGKTTLLNLVSGDHPQAYCNNVSLFGRRRGTGESVWDIKQKVGIISPDLQLGYRVSVSARICILSGLFDSIGVYQQASKIQRALADQWLDYMGMADRADRPVRSFSYGEQRLLLIARGLIKHPPLLILDEPCQGLDDQNRLKVLQLLGDFATTTPSTLLYVTHHFADRVSGIERHLQFVPTDNGFTVREESLADRAVEAGDGPGLLDKATTPGGDRKGPGPEDVSADSPLRPAGSGSPC